MDLNNLGNYNNAPGDGVESEKATSIFSEEEKQQLARESLAGIVGVCKLYKIDFFSLPKQVRLCLVDIHRAGAASGIEIVKKIW